MFFVWFKSSNEWLWFIVNGQIVSQYLVQVSFEWVFLSLIAGKISRKNSLKKKKDIEKYYEHLLCKHLKSNLNVVLCIYVALLGLWYWTNVVFSCTIPVCTQSDVKFSLINKHCNGKIFEQIQHQEKRQRLTLQKSALKNFLYINTLSVLSAAAQIKTMARCFLPHTDQINFNYSQHSIVAFVVTLHFIYANHSEGRGAPRTISLSCFLFESLKHFSKNAAMCTCWNVKATENCIYAFKGISWAMLNKNTVKLFKYCCRQAVNR